MLVTPKDDIEKYIEKIDLKWKLSIRLLTLSIMATTIYLIFNVKSINLGPKVTLGVFGIFICLACIVSFIIEKIEGPNLLKINILIGLTFLMCAYNLLISIILLVSTFKDSGDGEEETLTIDSEGNETLSIDSGDGGGEGRDAALGFGVPGIVVSVASFAFLIYFYLNFYPYE